MCGELVGPVSPYTMRIGMSDLYVVLGALLQTRSLLVTLVRRRLAA